MFIAAIIAVFILAILFFATFRAWLGSCTISPFDWINLLFSVPFTFLLVYYNVI